MEIEKKGDDITIGMNCRYFLDALRAVSDEKIRMLLGTPLTGIVITAEKQEEEGTKTPDEPEQKSEKNEKEEKEDEGSYLYMVCPVRMKD